MNSANTSISLPCSFTRRNIANIVSALSDIKSNVLIVKNGRSAPIKSVLGLISLCCNCGDKVSIVCMSRDSDAQADLNRVVEILNTIED